MKKILKNYGGLIFLYLVIFWGVFAICHHFDYIYEKKDITFVNK